MTTLMEAIEKYRGRRYWGQQRTWTSDDTSHGIHPVSLHRPHLLFHSNSFTLRTFWAHSPTLEGTYANMLLPCDLTLGPCDHRSRLLPKTLPTSVIGGVLLHVHLLLPCFHFVSPAKLGLPLSLSYAARCAQVALSETPVTGNAATERGNQPALGSARFVKAGGGCVSGNTSDGARANSSAVAKCPLSPPRPRTRTVRCCNICPARYLYTSVD